MRSLLLAVLLLVAAMSPVTAVTPDEVLKDPVLETRARDLSSGLRCMVCQNQSIDASDAELARDLRVLVRERLVAGDTDGEVIDYIVSRYGEFVLLKPRFSARTMMLWATPVIVLLGGGLLAFVTMRRRSASRSVAGLSPDEELELKQAMDENN